MLQVVEMTDREKLKAYMKLTKKELAKMLIESNRLLMMTTPTIQYHPASLPTTDPIWQVFPEHLPVYTTSSGGN